MPQTWGGECLSWISWRVQKTHKNLADIQNSMPPVDPFAICENQNRRISLEVSPKSAFQKVAINYAWHSQLHMANVASTWPFKNSYKTTRKSTIMPKRPPISLA